MRSRFKHSIELVDESGEIADHLAGVEDFVLAKATYDRGEALAQISHPVVPRDPHY